jgi:hypothetical protein
MGYGPISTELSRSPDKRQRRRPRTWPDPPARSQCRLARGHYPCRFRHQQSG